MAANTIKIADKKNTKIVAHRGCSGLETENTAVAFVAAGNRTYFGIETDIYRTADHKYMCNHDGETGRICEVNLKIEESNFDDLRALTLKDKDGKTDRAEIRLCTPQEYVKICKKYGKHAVTELKSGFTVEELKEILQIFADEDYLDNTTFIAFGMGNLERLKSVRPEQDCQYLVGDWRDELPELLAEKGMGLDIHWSQLTPERVELLHSKGIVVNCWTCDDPDDAQKLIDMGVDQITSNILE